MSYVSDILKNYKYIVINKNVRTASFDPDSQVKIKYFKTLYGVYKYLDNISIPANCKKHINVFENEDISYIETLISKYANAYHEIHFYIKLLEKNDIPNFLDNKIDCISTGSIVFREIDDGLDVIECKLNCWNKFECDDPTIMKQLINIHDNLYEDKSIYNMVKANGIYTIDTKLDYMIFDVECKFNTEAILSALVNKTSLISEEVNIECVDYKYFGYYIVNFDNFEHVLW